MISRRRLKKSLLHTRTHSNSNCSLYKISSLHRMVLNYSSMFSRPAVGIARRTISAEPIVFIRLLQKTRFSFFVLLQPFPFRALRVHRLLFPHRGLQFTSITTIIFQRNVVPNVSVILCTG
jgi:hypothetical protein